MNRGLSLALLSLFFIMVDQLVKATVVSGGGDVWLNSRGSIFLSLVGLGVAGTVCWKKTPPSRDAGHLPLTGEAFTRSLAMILSGGLSNLLDRLIWGGVVDIFHIGAFSFNLADGMIVAGAVLLLLV